MTSSLADSLGALSDILAAQLALCADLEETLRDKRHCLVHHELDTLQQLSEREQALALALSALEQERGGAAAALAVGVGLSPDAESSRVLSALPEHPGREQLAVLLKALGSKLSTLGSLNEDNRILANNLLEYTGMVLRLLAHGPGSASYGASGRLSDGAPRAMLDDRI